MKSAANGKQTRYFRARTALWLGLLSALLTGLVQAQQTTTEAQAAATSQPRLSREQLSDASRRSLDAAREWIAQHSGDTTAAEPASGIDAARAALQRKINSFPSRVTIKQSISDAAENIPRSNVNISNVINKDVLLVGRIENEAVKDVSDSASEQKTFVLPLKMTEVHRDGSSMDFGTVVEVPKPLAYDASRQAYIGRVRVRLEGGNGQLMNKIPFAFLMQGGDVNPAQVVIDHLNLPYTEVEVSMQNPSARESFTITSNLANGQDSIEIASLQPQLAIRLQPSNAIDGLGLATAAVTLEASNGENFERVNIDLQSTAGSFSDATIELDRSGRGTTRLRSAGLGNVVLTAAGGPFTNITQSAHYKFPLMFLLAAGLGAFAGASIQQRKKQGSMLTALICGLIGACLASLGVNFLELPIEIPAGEGFVLIVAFASAYTGPDALPFLKKTDVGEPVKSG